MPVLTDGLGYALTVDIDGALTDEYGAVLTDGLGAAISVNTGGDLTDEYGAVPVVVAPRPAVSFFVAEIEVYQPASAPQPYALGRGSHPRCAVTVLSATLESTDTLRVSDTGYRSRSSDADGVQVYPGLLAQAFAIDRHVGLEPGTASTATFGSIEIDNLNRRYDAYTLTRNTDSRAVRLLVGSKPFDTGRGIYLDPPRAGLKPFFGGAAQTWQLAEETLTIPLRDSAFAADRPLQSALYTGLGGYGGGADLTGLSIPITRGGTAANPVQNVPLIAVDAVHLIYQWTDGPGTLVTLYEGGKAVFTPAGDTTNLYGGLAPSPGTYRTDVSRGLVQMGSTPVNTLTADVTGRFATAGMVTTAAALARYILTETMAQPPTTIDLASFQAADAAYPYTAGIYVGTSATQGLTVVQTLLGSIGARMVTTRSGLLSAFVLRPVTADATVAASLSVRNVVAVTPQTLPATLDPPPSTWRVGYGENFTVQSSGLNGSIDAARTTFAANQFRFAAWFGASVALAYRAANRPAAVGTALLVQANAQALADELGALWGVGPKLYSVEMPIDAVADLDIGSVVQLDWPLGNLPGGRLGQIVGEQVRSVDGSVIFSVLVGIVAPMVTPAGLTAPLGVFVLGVNVLASGTQSITGQLALNPDGSQALAPDGSPILVPGV